MSDVDARRVAALQQRIHEALREDAAHAGTSTFSEYAPVGAAELGTALMGAASGGGIAGLEAMLDRAAELARSEDAGRLRYALTIALTHLPIVTELGLRLPSLAERAPWKIAPSTR